MAIVLSGSITANHVDLLLLLWPGRVCGKSGWSIDSSISERQAISRPPSIAGCYTVGGV